MVQAEEKQFFHNCDISIYILHIRLLIYSLHSSTSGGLGCLGLRLSHPTAQWGPFIRIVHRGGNFLDIVGAFSGL